MSRRSPLLTVNSVARSVQLPVAAGALAVVEVDAVVIEAEAEDDDAVAGTDAVEVPEFAVMSVFD